MVQFLADNIDQLDLALDQLAINDRNFDRFALMLVDNVAELTLHKFVQDAAYENELWIKLDKPIYNRNEIQKALRQNFDVKVKFARSMGFIDPSLCESLLYLHSFRNSSYHKGQRHEGILHSLTIFYFINVCKILYTFCPKFWVWSSEDKVSYRARKYLGGINWNNQKENFAFAFTRLEQVALSLGCHLIFDLHKDLEKTINTIDSAIDFLVNNSIVKTTRDEVIVNLQAWDFAFSEKAKDFAKTNEFQVGTIDEYVYWIQKNYQWTIKSDPISKWNKRLNSIKMEKDLHCALKKYCDFLKQTENIRNIIMESRAQQEAYIQNQIDISRGK
ncbi:MAG: hypothetical protein FMNOHCHN_02158 [Ignavibacteriaceae bacterium]|nr:hypothetical protein [Ignavibacteriaceae bacterium]